MTERSRNILVITPEPDKMCEYCGEIEETRPYGRNDEEICFKCAMNGENKKITETKFQERVL